MASTIEWIMLQEMFGYGSTKAQKIIDAYTSPDKLFAQRDFEYQNNTLLTQNDRKKLQNIDKYRVIAEKIVTDCEENDIKIITIDCEYYPDNLRNIYSPPLVIYYKGDITILKTEIAIGIVGTRNPSEYGIQVASIFSRDFAKYKVVTVSGLAKGIDTVVHRETLIANGRTIAVLGSGLGNIYPASNKELARVIMENGGLIMTEYPPTSPPMSYHFPIRNRIISAISKGVLVVEGTHKSGSLITAGHALTQGRDVFVVPGNIFSPQSEATNWLAREGAVIATSAKEIIEEYPYIHLETENKEDMGNIDERCVSVKIISDVDIIQEKIVIKENKNEEIKKEENKSTTLPPYLNELQKEVFLLIDKSPITSDEIARKLKIPMQKLLSVLTQLELFGLITATAGRTYILA